jgi:2-phosphoglycerate kinase
MRNWASSPVSARIDRQYRPGAKHHRAEANSFLPQPASTPQAPQTQARFGYNPPFAIGRVDGQGVALAKLLITDKEESIEIPFLRGILAHSLQKAGLTFQQAYAVAVEVRNQLGDDRTLSKLELHRIVYLQLKNDFGAKTADRYLRPAETTPAVQVEDLHGRLTPFSGELHRRELETIGLNLAESLKVARKLRRYLFREKLSQVSSETIAQVTQQILEEMPSLGPAVAERWSTWCEFQRSGRPLILIIGGTTGCGKSTIATALANQLGIVRMQSTDLLREVMRATLPTAEYPALHASSFDAWSHMGTDDGKSADGTGEREVGQGYQAQTELVSIASRAVIERAIRERESLIVEGVHAHPQLAAGMAADEDAVIVHVVLAVLKRKGLKQRLTGRATRAVKRRAKRYLKQFEQIWQLQSFLLDEADRTGAPIIVNNDRDDTIREIMRTVLNELSQTER